MRIFPIAIFLLLLPAMAMAQDESLLLNEAFVKDAQQAIDSVYNLNYEASLEIMQPWMEDHPDHPVWSFWPALEIWWKILPDLENTEYDNAFFNTLDVAKRVSEEQLDINHLDALIVKSISYGFSARHLSNRRSWYQSLSHARTAMGYFTDIERILPEMGDIQFGLGMSRYFSAYLRESYPIIRPFAWMLPPGSREGGLEHLNIAATNSTFLIPEATFFLGHIHLHYEKNFTEALSYLKKLTHRYPNNGYYHRLLIRSHDNNNNHQTAIRLINQTLARWENKTAAPDLALKEELYVLRGRILKQQGQEEPALEDFLKAYRIGENMKPAGDRRNFLKASYYLGEIYLKQGDRDTAEYFLKKVATSNLDFGYVDSAKSLLPQDL